MSRIHEVIQARKDSGEKVFVPYLCAGDPDIDTSLQLAIALDESGADIIEIGIPFSDPLADGPTIQRATQRSLDNGTRMKQVFELTQEIDENVDSPLVYMTYYNPIFRFGESRFIDRALEVGADGILVVDFPPEEGEDFYEEANDKGLNTVLLATPTTPPDRVEALSELASGFLYYVMVTGVTGVRSGYDPEIAEQLEMVGSRSEIPTVVGFGVSDISKISDYLDPIDGVVVGSYLIEAVNENLDSRDRMMEEIRSRARSLSEPLHQSSS